MSKKKNYLAIGGGLMGTAGGVFGILALLFVYFATRSDWGSATAVFILMMVYVFAGATALVLGALAAVLKYR
jgi:hypothetical protein